MEKTSRNDRRKKAEQKLETLLFEGLRSGEPIRADSTYWKRKRRKLAARLKKD